MLLKMKNKKSGIIIYDNSEDFLKAICEMQEQYNSRSNKKGADTNE